MHEQTQLPRSRFAVVWQHHSVRLQSNGLYSVRTTRRRSCDGEGEHESTVYTDLDRDAVVEVVSDDIWGAFGY